MDTENLAFISLIATGVSFPALAYTHQALAQDDKEGGYINNFGAVENNLAAGNNPQPVATNIGVSETQGARANLVWNVTEKLTATAGYMYQDSQGTGQPDVETVLGLVEFNPVTFEDIDVISVPVAQQISVNDLAVYAVGDESLNDEMRSPSLNLTYDTNNWGSFTYNFTSLDHSFRRGEIIENINPFADRELHYVFLSTSTTQTKRMNCVRSPFRTAGFAGSSAHSTISSCSHSQI